MRLRCIRAHAEEQLTSLLNDGYSLLTNIAEDRKAKRASGKWNEATDKAFHETLLNEWFNRLLTAVTEIFPTERERNEIIYPPSRGLSTVSGDDYHWQSLCLTVRDKLEAVKEIIDHALSRYTDLPQTTRLYVEDIDSFQKVRDVNPSMVARFLTSNGYFDRSEDEIQHALEQILNVSFHKKDWGGETNDLYTANVVVNGARIATAFMLKGNGLRKGVMEIADCGKNGDQILRLVGSPAVFFVVQFVGEVSEAAIKDLEGKVNELRGTGKPACYCVMNGQDTARVMLAYGKLR